MLSLCQASICPVVSLEGMFVACVIGVCSQMVSGGCLYMGVVVWAVSMSAVLSLEGNISMITVPGCTALWSVWCGLCVWESS